MKKYTTPEFNFQQFDFQDVLTNSGPGNAYDWEEEGDPSVVNDRL